MGLLSEPPSEDGRPKETMKPLYAYHDLDLSALLRFAREASRTGFYHWAILYCTGAGKTLLSLAFGTTGMRCEDEPALFTHILIAAPSLVTRDHFIASDFSFQGQPYTMPEIKIADSVGIDRYMALPTPNEMRLATHQLLAGAKMREWLASRIAFDPCFCKGRLLIIDEAHRTGEKLDVTEFRNMWLKAGGFVLSLTATPDRSDQTIAIAADVPRVTRTMSMAMADGFAPENLRSEVLHIDGEVDTDPNTDTFCAPLESAEAPIFAHMEQDGCPKSIIRLKSTGGREKHTADILALVREAKRHNRRVFVASGHRDDGVDGNDEISETNQQVLNEVRKRTGKKGSGDLSEVLAYEDSIKHYNASCLDVIIGMQTVLEGLDWRICSHLYLIGVPSEILPLAQGIGRPTRMKKWWNGVEFVYILGYPEDWRETSKVVLITAGDKDKIIEAHANQTIKVACYLAALEQWTALGMGSKSFKMVHFASPEEQELARREIQKIWDDTPEGETRRRRAIEAMTLALAFYNEMVLEEGLPLTNQEKARITKLFIGARLSVQYGDVEEADVLSALRRLSPAKGREVADFVREKVEQGQGIVEAHRAAHAALSSAEDDPCVETPSVITEALRYLPLQSFTLTSEVVEQVAAQALPKGRVTRHQPGGIAAAIENLRR